MKKIKIYIKIIFETKDDKIFQTVEFLPANFNKFIFDERFLIARKFKRYIKKYFIGNGKDILFLEEKNENNNLIIIYKNLTNEKYFKTYFANISDVIPDNTGCENCAYLNEKYCEKKNKNMIEFQKSCKWFKQKFKLKS